MHPSVRPIRSRQPRKIAGSFQGNPQSFLIRNLLLRLNQIHWLSWICGQLRLLYQKEPEWNVGETQPLKSRSPHGCPVTRSSVTREPASRGNSGGAHFTGAYKYACTPPTCPITQNCLNDLGFSHTIEYHIIIKNK